MKIARRFVLVLVALVLMPWVLSPILTGRPWSHGHPFAIDLSHVDPIELAGRLPMMMAFLAGAVLITYILGRLRWAEERTKQLDSLFEAGDAIVSLQSHGSDAHTLIKGTCGKLVQTRAYDAAWIALRDEAGQFVQAAEMGHTSGFTAVIEQMKRGQWPSCALRALAESEPVIIRDTVSQCAGCPLQAKRYGKASLALRIGTKKHVYGVACITAPAAIVTSREEHAVLTRIARDLAHALRAIETSRTHKRTTEELERERAIRSAVADSADALSDSACTVPDIAERLLEHALRLTESRNGFVHEVDERTGAAVPYTGTGPSVTRQPPWSEVDAIALMPDENGTYDEPWGEALNTREPFYRNATRGGEGSENAGMSTPSHTDPAQALVLTTGEPITPVNDRVLAVPAVACGELVGQIVLAGPHRAYTDSDLDAVVRLAEIFAVAVQRARSERSLRIREGTVAAVLDPTIVTDTDGVITFANDAFRRMWELDEQHSAVGLAVNELCGDANELGRLIESALRGENASAEMRVERDGRAPLEIGASARAISDPAGDLLRVAVTLRDLTEVRLAENTETALWKIAEAACTMRDLGLVFRKTRQELSKVMNTRNFFVAMYDKETNTISLPLFADENDQNQFETLPAGKTLTAYVMRKSSPVLATRKEIDSLVESGAVEIVGTPCEVWLGAPMMADDHVIGIVAVQSYDDQNDFGERDLQTLAHAAAELAPAVAKKRTETTLSEERNRFGAVAETINSALINTDSHGRILAWNRSAEVMFGYSSTEAVGQPFSLIVPEGFLQAHVDGLMRAASSDSQGYVRASVEGVGRRKDGSEFPMELSIGAWKSGDETFFTALLADVTTRRQIEEEIQFLGSIPLQVSDALIVTDLNYRVTYVNKAAEFLFGYAGEELIGHTLDLLSAEEWEEQFEEEVHRTVSAGRIWTGAMRNKRKNGTTFQVEYRISPLRDSSGRLSSYIAICHDLTERMRTDQLLSTLNAAALAMERSLTPESILAAVTEEMRAIDSSCALFLVDEETGGLSVGYVSPGFAGAREDECSEESREELPELLLDSFAPLARTVREKKSNFLAGAEETASDYTPTLTGDTERWVDWALSGRPTILAPLITGEDVTGVLAVQSAELASRDVPAITAFANQLAAAWRKTTLMQELGDSLKELRRTQDILLRAQKMEAVGNLAGGVAHDFNNLLTAITGYAELALTGLDPEGSVHQDICQIRKAAAQAASLTSQLLAFSRQTPLQPKVISVNEVVSNLDKMMRRLIGEDVELKADLDPGLARIKADPTQVQQVVMNLIINGRDAMPGGGTLSISTENVTLTKEDCESKTEAVPGDYVLLSVKDTGTGIDPEVIDRIFEPFFTTKDLGKGTGLGLSVVYGVVSQHDGWIDIDSTLGEGTTFLVYLPTTSDEAVDALYSERTPEKTNGNGERILLVEDEDSVRDFALRALRESGYTVLEAADADEALAIVNGEKDKVDLVFSDVVLPTKSGLELVEELQSEQPDIRVLLASGYTDTKSQWEAIRQRGFGFLQKPYGIGELLRTIREAMSAN